MHDLFPIFFSCIAEKFGRMHHCTIKTLSSLSPQKCCCHYFLTITVTALFWIDDFYISDNFPKATQKTSSNVHGHSLILCLLTLSVMACLCLQDSCLRRNETKGREEEEEVEEEIRKQVGGS